MTLQAGVLRYREWASGLPTTPCSEILAVMSRESVNLVLAFHTAYNAREVDAAVDLCAADVAVFPDASVFPEGGVVGRNEYRAFLEETWSAWKSCSAKVEEVLDVEDGRVLIRGDWGGIGIASGVESYRSLNSIYTVRDGQISKVEYFFDHAKALEAVGLSE
jgi:ketosteroid isomerase-like protein